jgi:3-oxoadipate enol-lactonase
VRRTASTFDLGGPYDVEALTSDLDVVLADAGFARCAVMGYSHGGAVAQEFARTRPAAISRLILACTYACNVSTLRERLECSVFLALLRLFDPGTLAKVIMHRRNRAPLAR